MRNAHGTGCNCPNAQLAQYISSSHRDIDKIPHWHSAHTYGGGEHSYDRDHLCRVFLGSLGKRSYLVPIEKLDNPWRLSVDRME